MCMHIDVPLGRIARGRCYQLCSMACRELLMTAAMSIKTPVMSLPLLPPLPEPQRKAAVDGMGQAEKGAVLQNRLRRLSFAEILRREQASD